MDMEKIEALVRQACWDGIIEIECPKCGVPHPKRMLSCFITGQSAGSGGSVCAPTSPT